MGKTSRIYQGVLIASTIAFSWMSMMVLHEAGHVLHAWWSGGTVAKVVLHPLRFSRTDLSHNPHPLFVAWGGAVWGCVLPVAAWGVTQIRRWTHAYLLRFLAGFCLAANGLYLSMGSFSGAGDAGDLLHWGSPRWLLVLFGVFATAAGLWLWHGQGPHFGLGRAHGRVDPGAAIGALTATMALVAVELLLF